MHWFHGGWTVQYHDQQAGWVPGTARVDLSGLTIDPDWQEIPSDRVSVTYTHPRHGQFSQPVLHVVLSKDRAIVKLDALKAHDTGTAPQAGTQTIAAPDGTALSVMVGAETAQVPIEEIVAPSIELTLSWNAPLHIAEGIWRQELEDDAVARFGARFGNIDRVGALSYGAEQWARPSPIFESIAVVPAKAPADHINPLLTSAAKRERHLWVFGTILPDVTSLEATSPFTARNYRVLSGADRQEALTATGIPDRSDLMIAAVTIEWAQGTSPSEGAHSLYIDGLKVDWPLKWADWNLGMAISRDSSSDPATQEWRVTDKVWPHDKLVVEFGSSGSVSYEDDIEIRVRSLSVNGNSIAEKTIKVPGGQQRSEEFTLKEVGGTGSGLEVEPLGDIEVSYVSAPSSVPAVKLMIDDVPAAGNTPWDRQLNRAANVWNVPVSNPSLVVDTSVVQLQLRDHAALLLLQFVFTSVLHSHIETIQQETLSAWRRRLREMVRPRALSSGAVQTPPIANTPVTGPGGEAWTAAIFLNDAPDVALTHNVDPQRLASWWSTGLAEVRRAYIRSVREARRKVMAVADNDVDGLLSIAAVAGGEPAQMAAQRLVRWDDTVSRVIDDTPARAVVVSIGTVAAHAQALDELEGVVLAIVGATVAVLTGGIAYFAAAPALIGGAILVGAAVDFTLLAIDLENWSDQDWRVEVASSGAVVVGEQSYRRAMAQQTPGWLRGVAIAGTILGPLVDGVQVFSKTAQVTRTAATEAANRVLRASNPEDALRELAHAERVAFVRYLDDALRRVDDGVDIANLSQLEARAVGFVNRMSQMSADAFTASPIRQLLAEVPNADGTLMRYSAAGACTACSVCMSFRWLYQAVLERNPQMALRLAQLEADLKAVGRVLDPSNPVHQDILTRGAALQADLAAELAAHTGPAVRTLVPLRQACRSKKNRVLYDRLLNHASLDVAEAVGAHASAGNRRLAVALVKALASPARVGETDLLIQRLARVPGAQEGLMRLLQAGDEFPMIAGWLTQWVRTKNWRLGNPESLAILLSHINRLSPTQMDGLKALFKAGSHQMLSGNHARRFTRALIDSAERLIDANQAALFDDMLEMMGELSQRSGGMSRIASMFASTTDNIYEGGLFQIMLAARRLRDFGPQAHVVFEVNIRNAANVVIRQIDVVIYDSAPGPAARILLEIEAKAHNSLHFIETMSTMSQWVRDIARVAADTSRPLTSVQWSFSGMILRPLGTAATMSRLEQFFKAPFTPTGRAWLQTLPDPSGKIGEVLHILNSIDSARLAQLGTEMNTAFSTIVKFD